MRKLSLMLVIFVFSIASLLAQSVPPAAGEVEKRVDALLSRLTLEEKIDILGGVDDFFIRNYPQIGLPRLKMADGPLGVRNASPPATAMAGGISLAASWDRAIAARVGKEIGRDARARGVHFMLGPAVNIYRAPMNGRNFEYLGEDPYLAGQIAVAYIEGLQSQGVSATIKHFLGNNSEFDRHNTDAFIDERTMREIYLPAFEAAVKQAHVGAVMDSYNLVNGSHLTQNKVLNIDILKDEWGFQGILMSDWASTYDAVAAANSGLDLEMPSGLYMNRKNLLPAVQNGDVSVATINDKVRRILRIAVTFGWLDRDQTDLSISRYNREGDQVALDAAREGAVLLKNDGNLLPLREGEVKSVLVVGPNTYPAMPTGGGSAQVEGYHAVSVLQGIGDYLGRAVHVFYSPGVLTTEQMAAATFFSTNAESGKPNLRAEYFENENLQGAPFLGREEAHLNIGPPNGNLLPDRARSSRWTGYYRPAVAGKYELFVESTGEDGGYYRAYVDDKLLLDDWHDSKELLGIASLSLDSGAHKIVLEHRGRSTWLDGCLRMGIVSQSGYVSSDAKVLAAKSDVVVVAVGFDPESESEGGDRTFRLPPGQDELIKEMLTANRNTVVVLNSGGGVDMNAWIDRTPALLHAWYPGQEGGRAIAEILFGAVNPSGRLPVTVERHWEDNPVYESYYPKPGTNRVVYKEGVFVGYRGIEKSGTIPLFPFGYGLSYTTFAYSRLSVKSRAMTNTEVDAPNSLVDISFDVKNTGSREGADVAQIYVADPHSKVPRPAKELKGFARIELKPGETRTATLTLDRRAFSYYDVQAKSWKMPDDEFDILVGRSSQDIELRGSFSPTGQNQLKGN